MEESEKRRERLRLMRDEASEAQDGSHSFQSLATTDVLANPLVETPIIFQDSHAMSRFDYYTDPMAAYSGNRRPNNFIQTPQGNSMSRGRGNPVMQYQPPPFGPRNPQMTPQPNHYPNQGIPHGWRPPSYASGPIRSPMPVFNPHPEHQYHSFPNQPGNPSGHYPPLNSPSGPPMSRPGYWPNSGPAFQNQGRGGTHFSNQGRGSSRGHWNNNSPGRGGRGVGYQGEARSGNLYRKSMVEDPWKELKPVGWRAVGTSARSSEVFRKLSSDAKKPRVEETCSSMPKSNESLADYLAAAFDEAAEGGDAL